jgi:hypothetical protein
MELILLAQLSPEGYAAANGIISKIFKAVSDKKTLDNPSGFLHRCAQNARDQLTPAYRPS